MSRLEELGVVNVEWTEDETGNVFAEGLQEYEIDTKNELAVFQAEKCTKVIQAVDFCHAVSMVYAGEAVCRWNLRNGRTGNGNRINERGWDLRKRA